MLIHRYRTWPALSRVLTLSSDRDLWSQKVVDKAAGCHSLRVDVDRELGARFN